VSWTIVPINKFEDYATQWNALNQIAGNSPLTSTAFVQPLLNNFSSGNELLVIYGDLDTPSAMGVLNKQGWGSWQTFQPSQAPIGLWLKRPEINALNLCKQLKSDLPGPVLSLGLTQQDPKLAMQPKPSSSFQVLDYIETAHVNIDSDFEDYWKSRSKNLRQNLKRQRNRLAREGTSTRIETVTDKNRMEDCVRDYGSLESQGWKSTHDTAISAENSQGRFYTEMLQRFARENNAIVFRYFYDEELVATDLCISGNGDFIILKTTYDEAQKTSSPAMLMRQEAFKILFEQRKNDKIEFYGRVMDWHRQWAHETRHMYHITSYWPLVGLYKQARNLVKS
jgi:CelD/BcsL family acetyltransferase involved in cellulose biosynthesis